jgi:phospholipase C
MSGGTTQGYVYDPGNDDHAPQLGATTIFQLLDQHGISWKIYYAHTNSDGSPSTTFTYFSYSNKYIYKSGNQWIIDHTHVAPISQYYTDVANGALPQFAYIETNYGVSDEHPGSGQSIFSGQQFVAQLVNSLMNSRSWSSSVFFLSYDEAGGPYDHVPPVPSRTGLNTDSSLAPLEGDVSRIAVNPDSYWPCQPSIPGNYTNHCDLRPSDPGSHPNDVPKVYGFAGQIGFRVPNMIISPFTRKHYVGHVTMDHTAVLRFVEERFNLPSLTARDAAQPDLYDYFDFSNPPWATPPSGVPTAPPVGSTCHASNFVP